MSTKTFGYKFLCLIVIISITGCFFVDSEKEESPHYIRTQNPEVAAHPVATSNPLPITVIPDHVTVDPPPISTPVSKPSFTAIDITDLPETENKTENVQEKTLDSFHRINSFKYILEGVARVDAGGIFVAVPLSGSGAVTSLGSLSKFEANLLGIGLYVESAKIGDEIYIKESPTDKWEVGENLGIGHITNDFWKAVGDSFLKTEVSDFNIQSTEGKITFLFDDSGTAGSVAPLFELIATQEEIQKFSPETWEVKLEVDPISYQMSKIASEFSLRNGGLFLSEVFGMEGLSGVGTTDVEFHISFSRLGEDFDLDLPSPAN